ncbi:MAG: tRNA threonylcarbamoyladenosine dehydratase [Fermentimonas sp.]|jgi:tRNA A37 threonylcarbamoyladenosine dehydratase
MTYNDLFARTRLLLGDEAMQQIMSKNIILFGVGGVGSWCAEALIRNGFNNLTIVDSDTVSEANINRQLPATTKTVGQLKVDVLKDRLNEINPYANINAIPKIYNNESSDSFHLDKYDYIIDAIDTLPHKMHLLVASSKTDATVFSSMGAGLKIDPLQVKVAEFWKVRTCKLAKALRTKMKKEQKPMKPILCVYSEEQGQNRGDTNSKNIIEESNFTKQNINGTLMQVTAMFGITLSSLVVKDIMSKIENPI